MSKNAGVIRSGPFKGKKITFASTERVEEFKAIADDFMLDVFELEPGDYAISDESDLRDFASFIEEDRVDAWKQMREHYGLKREELQSTLLIDVFEEIANRRKLQ